MTPPSSLDALLERARTTSVRRDLAATRVAELDRWAGARDTTRWWRLGFATALAAVAILVVVLVWPRREDGLAAGPVVVGDRVAILAEPAAAYRVARTEASATEIAIDGGAVTARLWPGREPHRLVLRGGGIAAEAVGTVYTLAVDDRGPHVTVHEGTVTVTTADDRRIAVAAGTTWPDADDVGAGMRAAERLLAMAPPREATPDRVVVDAALDAGIDAPDLAFAVDAATADATTTRQPVVHDASAPTAVERWRNVRLLRGQNKLAEAVAECEALADARDSTWSPIALVEAARIELGPRAAPERAIAFADRLLREWPAHALAADARDLRCRALRQLGRDAECKTAP